MGKLVFQFLIGKVKTNATDFSQIQQRVFQFLIGKVKTLRGAENIGIRICGFNSS